MDAWDIFCMTGHVDDYLHYRQTTLPPKRKAQTVNRKPSKEKTPYGDVSGSGAGGTERRGPGEISGYSTGK